MKKILAITCFLNCTLWSMEQSKKLDPAECVGVKVIYRSESLTKNTQNPPVNTLPSMAELVSRNNTGPLKEPELKRTLTNVMFVVVTQNLIICGYENGVIELLDKENQARIADGKIITAPRFLALSQDNKYLVVVADNESTEQKLCKIFVYCLTDPQNCSLVKELTEHTQDVLHAKITPTNILVTASKDGTIKLWNLADPSQIAALKTLSKHTCKITSLALTDDGKYLISRSLNDGVVISDIQDPAMAQSISAIAAGLCNVRLPFEKNKIQYFLLEENESVCIYSLENPQNPVKVNEFSHDVAYHLCSRIVSKDFRYLIGGDNKGKIYVWDIADPKHAVLIGKLNSEKITSPISALYLGPDNILFAGAHDGMVYNVNFTDPRLLRVKNEFKAHDAKDKSAILQIAFLSERVFMTEGADNVVKFWQLP